MKKRGSLGRGDMLGRAISGAVDSGLVRAMRGHDGARNVWMRVSGAGGRSPGVSSEPCHGRAGGVTGRGEEPSVVQGCLSSE